MNRFIKISVFIFISLFFISFSWALSIVNSKHDMSSTSTSATIKAATEAEICKFCHIPHSASTAVQAPLWNRIQPTNAWTMYNSAYLTAISYTLPSAPSERTKLCLSCHDGTIAIGNLVRKGPVTMANNVTTMPTAQAGYLGTNLTDDHPVSIKYDTTVTGANLQNPGPGTYPTVSGLNIKLYSVSGVKYVECTSCHEPHNNANSKFLVASFYSGNVANFCTACHNPPNWTGSAHQSSTKTITAGSELAPYGANVSAAACMNCHKPHSSPGIPYLRRFGAAEEATCYGGTATNLPCHGSSSEASKADKVGTQFGLAYKHPVTATTGNHTHYTLENDVKLGGGGVRHAECVDCHNPHQVKTQTGFQLQTSSNQTARLSCMIPYRNALIGSWGVMPTGTQDDGGNTTGWPATGAPWTFNKTSPYAPLSAGISSTGYTKFTYGATPPDQAVKGDATPTGAAYLCLKCHSQYAFGTSPPTVTTATTHKVTDVTANFNPNNYAFHPVFMRGQNRPDALNTNFNLAFVNSRGIWSDSYITCYDCHASSTSTDPRGPHGSANKWILRSNETGTGDGVTTNFCLNCHNCGTYGDEGPSAPASGCTTNTYSRYPHDYSRATAVRTTWGFAGCVNCHGGDSYGGIHGSSFGIWSGKGPRPRSQRMLNGATWLGSSNPTTTAGPACWTTTTAANNETGFDASCQRGHTGNVSGSAARYNYNWTQYTID